MKHLIVYSHPNPKSFCHAILDSVNEALREKKHEVVVRDLYEMKFDPILKGSDFVGFKSGNIPADIKTEQAHIVWADVMTMIYPVWWTGLPAMIKGYIDRVYSFGFAYSMGANGIVKLLTTKKVIVFNTQGTPKEVYAQSGMTDAMKKTSDTGIFDFCGIQVLHHQFFPSVPFVDDAARKGYLAEVKKVMNQY